MTKILNTITAWSLFLCAMAFTACNETDPDEAEFANWQERNEAYFDDIYKQAKANVGSSDKSWKIIPAYSFNADAAIHSYDNIVVQVLEEGTGSSSPLFTDTVRVHYEGRYIPTSSYPSGFRFDSSWTGEYQLSTMLPAKFLVGGTVEGFATALQYMHVGDRWKVYIPYQLGYGESGAGSGAIQGFSTLIFDITLLSFHHPGTIIPSDR